MKTLKWIERTLGKRKWMIVLLGVLQSVLAICGIVFALLMRRAIDSAIDSAVSGRMLEFQRAVIALVGIIFLQMVLYALHRYLEEDTRAVVENRFRQKVFHGILAKEYKDVTGYHTGELMNRLTSDASVVMDGAVTLFPSLLSMAVRIVGVLVVMASIQLWMAVVFLIAGCLMAVLSVGPRKWQKRLHKKVQETDGQVRSFLQESLESLLVVHAFGCEDKVEADSWTWMDKHRRVRRKRSNAFNLFGTGMRFVMQSGYVFGFAWCGLGIIKGSMSYGTLTAVLQLIGQIQTPFANMGSAIPKYTSMLASAERLMELAEDSERVMKCETPAPNAECGLKSVHSREAIYSRLESIDFENVSFAYDADRPVLKEESFSVKKGEFAALIGSSGIGKSTIMKLLLSVYEPNSGEIFVRLREDDNEALSKDGEAPGMQSRLQLDALPSGMFAYVPQGNYLMSGPIWQVVGFAQASDDIDRNKVVEACKIACAHEFIEQLPQGYETVLGERGSGLSEGQMQRIAVARAVYSGCPILLLDEATSALDADTERRMICSLKEMSDYTVFLVTHRRDVWELCDRVLERKE